MKIGVITPIYPSPRNIEFGAFVENLVLQWKSHGVDVYVAAPISISNVLRNARRTKHGRPIAGDQVLSPIWPSFSSRRIGFIDPMRINRWFFSKVVFSALKKMPVPDLYYGKFLLSGGVLAAKAGQLYGRPAFADLGESVLLQNMSRDDRVRASKAIDSLSGLVCLSDRLMHEAIELGADPNRILLAPNCADASRFHSLDRQQCRNKLALPQDVFIVVFVGHFIERKGPLRVMEALKRVNRPVYGVFLGKGPQTPQGSRLLHAGPVSNADMPLWLGASDLMMLPTLAEGSCNAIAEAQACGLPVISSDIEDVRGQIPEGTGILVNPTDIVALANALVRLFDNPSELEAMRKQLASHHIELQAKQRGAVILDWMNDMLTPRP